MTMQEYWKQVKSEALDSMRRLIGQDVDDNCEDINAGLEANKGTMSILPKIPDFAREFLGVTLERVVITQEYTDYFFDKIIPTVTQLAAQ